eukprot:gene27029-2256_t
MGPYRRIYTPYEVVTHNTPDDAWVSFLGKVCDITKLIKEYPGKITEPLIAAAGQDISHWFDPQTNDVKKYICPQTHLERYYTPMPRPSGRPLQSPHAHTSRPPARKREPDPTRGNRARRKHIPGVKPRTSCLTMPHAHRAATMRRKGQAPTRPRIGNLSSRVRVVRIKNVLTGQEDKMEVPSEEYIVEIRERYLELNWHAKSYSWKALLPSEEGELDFVELDMNKTLQGNGILDETMTFEDCQMPTDKYIPVLHVYWNDDLTVE